MVCLFVPRQLMFVFFQVVRVSGGYLILCSLTISLMQLYFFFRLFSKSFCFHSKKCIDNYTIDKYFSSFLLHYDRNVSRVTTDRRPPLPATATTSDHLQSSDSDYKTSNNHRQRFVEVTACLLVVAGGAQVLFL